VTVKGHSLGSTLAMLCTFDVVETRANVSPGDDRVALVCVFSFAGPLIGKEAVRAGAGHAAEFVEQSVQLFRADPNVVCHRRPTLSLSLQISSCFIQCVWSYLTCLCACLCRPAT
jgi:hypothetical protein